MYNIWDIDIAIATLTVPFCVLQVLYNLLLMITSMLQLLKAPLSLSDGKAPPSVDASMEITKYGTRHSQMAPNRKRTTVLMIQLGSVFQKQLLHLMD